MFKIRINDQNMVMYINLNDNKATVSFSDSSLDFLKSFINVITRKNKTIITLGNKKICEIKDEKIIYKSKITSTEIRVLSSIYNSLNIKDVSSTDMVSIKEKVKEQMSNVRRLNRFKWSDTQKLKTELHTHLIEILSAEEFVYLLDIFHLKFPIKNGELDFSSEDEYSLDELIAYGYKDNVINALKLDLTKKTTFDDLLTVNKNRNILLSRCSKLLDVDLSSIENERTEYLERIELLEEEISKLRQKSSKETNGKNKNELNRKANELKKEVGQIKCKINNLKHKSSSLKLSEMYSILLETSLNKLKYEGIEYSEISFSTFSTLKYLSDEYKNKEHPNFRLLMSIDRNKDVSSFKEASSELFELLKDNVVAGVDIVGLESKFNDETSKTFEESLEWIVPVLHMYPNSVLRFHAGEFKDTTDNVYKTLLSLKRVKTKLNTAYKKMFGVSFGIVPPPRIRIGHAINIEQKPELIELLKEFDCIVEFNVSSNYALSHVSDLSKIPIEYYDRNKIKYVFSTDGGGMYSTSLIQEENIAKNLSAYDVPGSTGKTKSDYIKSAQCTEQEVISISEPSYKLDIEKVESQAKRYLEHLSQTLGKDTSTIDSIVDKILESERRVSQEIDDLYREMLDSDAGVYDEYIYDLIEQAKEKVKLDESSDALVLISIARTLKNGTDKFMNMILSIDDEISNNKKVSIESLRLIKKYTSDYLNYRENYLDRIYNTVEKNERKR